MNAKRKLETFLLTFSILFMGFNFTNVSASSWKKGYPSFLTTTKHQIWLGYNIDLKSKWYYGRSSFFADKLGVTNGPTICFI